MRVGKHPISSKAALAIFAIILLGTSSWAAPREKVRRPGKEGFHPETSLILDPSGSLYGTTEEGGIQHAGTVFKLTPNADGRWTESVIYSFCSLTNCQDGKFPLAGVIFDEVGNLYGTTEWGGTCKDGCGTVFKLAPNADGSWAESVLYRFCSLTNCLDGDGPSSSLIFDKEGNLYGTTVSGGVNVSVCPNDCGTVFKLAPNADGSWTESVLYSFCSLTNCLDGAGPYSGVIFDKDGNLYGTTHGGGNFVSCPFTKGCGTVFELTPSSGGWTERTLHKFINNGKDGIYPYAGLIFDTVGNLYGTTYNGGDIDVGYGLGTVFELKPQKGPWAEIIVLTSTSKVGSNLLLV